MANPKKTPATPGGEDVALVNEMVVQNIDFCIVGMSPLVPHAMSKKAWEQLLFPSPKKNQAERASSMKHEPWDEFREACYLFEGEEEPTRLYLPGSMFHSALAQAAIDMSGAKKSQTARLTNIPQQKLPLYGVPQIHCSIVRSSDMARTPDVRTLPILEKWATSFTVEFPADLIKPQSIVNLMGGAGRIVGVGDGRPEKGKLSNGRFRICSPDDVEFKQIVKSGGRVVQDKALADPEFFDVETKRILTWFDAEVERRHAQPVTRQPARGRKNVLEAAE